MRVLVTGAAGFFGAHVCRTLAAAGHVPIAAIRETSRRWRLDALAPGVAHCAMDLREPRSIGPALAAAAPDAVVNCAGYGVNYGEQNFSLAYATNVIGAMDLAKAAGAAGVPLIQIGTSYEYGSSDRPLDEDAPLMPKGVYGTTKAAASLLIAEQARSGTLQAVVLRLFSMYGPLEGRHKIVPAAMAARRTGVALALTPGGQVRDYTYVEDVARAVLLCLTTVPFPTGQMINVASGIERSLRALLEAANEGSEGLQWGARPYRHDELMSVVGRPTRAAALLHWSATTTIEAGMAQTRAFDDLRTGED